MYCSGGSMRSVEGVRGDCAPSLDKRSCSLRSLLRLLSLADFDMNNVTEAEVTSVTTTLGACTEWGYAGG